MFNVKHECAFMRANVHATLHIQRWRPNGSTDRDPNWYKHSLGKSAQVTGVDVRVARARAARNPAGTAVRRKRKVGEQARGGRRSAKRENKREAREYMNGIWRHIRSERDARMCAPCAQRAYRGAWSKTKKNSSFATNIFI
jgi:hypothetical protein